MARNLLESGVEVFDEMAGLVHLVVERTPGLAVALGWNDTGLARFVERFDDALVGIEGFVGQQSIGLHVRQQRVGALQIMGLARSQKEAEWIAQGIDQGVDLCAQSASAAPDRLVRRTVFLGAPVACWCARTMVLSIIAYSLSASAASTLNTFSQTPLLAQRV